MKIVPAILLPIVDKDIAEYIYRLIEIVNLGYSHFDQYIQNHVLITRVIIIASSGAPAQFT